MVGTIIGSIAGIILGVIILVAVGMNHEKGIIAGLRNTYWYIIGGLLTMSSIAALIGAIAGTPSGR